MNKVKSQEELFYELIEAAKAYALTLRNEPKKASLTLAACYYDPITDRDIIASIGGGSTSTSIDTMSMIMHDCSENHRIITESLHKYEAETRVKLN